MSKIHIWISFYLLMSPLTVKALDACPIFLGSRAVNPDLPAETEWVKVTDDLDVLSVLFTLPEENSSKTERLNKIKRSLEEGFSNASDTLNKDSRDSYDLDNLERVSLPIWKRETRQKDQAGDQSTRLIREERFVKTPYRRIYIESLDPKKTLSLKTDRKHTKQIVFNRSRKERVSTRMPSHYDVPVVNLKKISNVYLEKQKYGFNLEADPNSGLLAETEDGTIVELRPLNDSNKSGLREQIFLRSIGARPQKVFVSEYQGRWYWGSEIQFSQPLDLEKTYSSTHEDHQIDSLYEFHFMPELWRVSLENSNSSLIDFFQSDEDGAVNSRLSKSQYGRLLNKLMSVLAGLDRFNPYFFQQSSGYETGYAVFLDQLLPQMKWYIDTKTGQLGLDIENDMSQHIPLSYRANGNEALGPTVPIVVRPFEKGGRAYGELIMFLSLADPIFTKMTLDYFLKRKDLKKWWLLVQSIKGWISQTRNLSNHNLIQGLALVFKEVDLSKSVITGFVDEATLESHFERHKNDFMNPPESKEEYYEMAIEFITETSEDLISVQRADGAFMKYDSETDEFAVLDASGRLITYYILKADRDNDEYLGRNVHRGRLK